MGPAILSRAQAVSQGLKTYFTGKPCKHGHIANRAVVNGTCFRCSRLADAPRQIVRLAKKRAKKRARKEAARKAYDSAMRAEWGDRYVPRREALKRGLRYYFTGKPCRQGHLSKRDINNNSCVECRLLATDRGRRRKPKVFTWRVASDELTGRGFNPESQRVRLERMRAKRRKANGFHSTEDIKELHRLQKGRCAECRRRLKSDYHVDHRVPLSLGGDNTKYNIQLTCPGCNCKKGGLHPLEWARRNGRLL